MEPILSIFHGSICAFARGILPVVSVFLVPSVISSFIDNEDENENESESDNDNGNGNNYNNK